MPDDLPVTRTLVIPGAELSERFSRSSGPGGQGVNTTDSRVELSYDVAASSLPPAVRSRVLDSLAGRLVDGVLTVSASEFRTQLANRRAARERLAALVRSAAGPPPPKRRPTKPTRGSQRRRLEAKKQRSQTKRLRRGPDE
ncbi:alternative ribosome rescue aminoacyl-tRNA hydrolase ArfB [Nocardioides sp. 31GB23]|uniref:Ribosome-associated protein n=1 Tax=Nocardioides salarius TaxID=374513 RepID=A0ABS2MC00_9ACTN|nr:alternative ribosome rescue aminoacyl-tRNA hydrolase ArfB [Nocardioides salarius]MBM7508680.1 ribosome-associated protein [Nocardioides salarius]